MRSGVTVSALLIILIVFSSLAYAQVAIEPKQVVPVLLLCGLAAANDQQIRDTVQSSRTPGGDAFYETVTIFGSGGGLAIVGSLAVLGEKETAYKAANAIIYAGITTQILKNIVGRPRPYTAETVTQPLSFSSDYASFPSGHTATAFALAHVLASEYPRYKYLFYGGAVLVGISRIYLDQHYTSDVIAGAAIGIYAGSHVPANSYLYQWQF